MAQNVASSSKEQKLVDIDLIINMKEQSDILLAYFEEINDKENFLRTIIIQQQLRFISSSYALLDQMKAAVKGKEAAKPKKIVIQPKKIKGIKRKLEN